MYAAPDAAPARSWILTGYMAIPFVPVAVYCFTVQILGPLPRRRVVMGSLLVAAALLAVLFVGAGLFTEGMIRYPWGWIEALNVRGWLLVGYLVAGLGAALLEYGLALRVESSSRRRRQLGMLVAEGVETGAERTTLVDLGCLWGQGFLFARPMPAADFEEKLRDERAFAE